jgi:hypothetical protein
VSFLLLIDQLTAHRDNRGLERERQLMSHDTTLSWEVWWCLGDLMSALSGTGVH